MERKSVMVYEHSDSLPKQSQIQLIKLIKEYKKLYPTRELHVFHTSRTDVQIVEEFFSWIHSPFSLK